MKPHQSLTITKQSSDLGRSCVIKLLLLMSAIFMPTAMTHAQSKPKARTPVAFPKMGTSSLVPKVSKPEVKNAKVSSKISKKPTAAKAPEVTSIDTPLKETGNYTRIVRAADSIQASGLSETLALAFDGQYLVVPWSFVSDITLARRGTKFYVDRPNQEAQLVEVDLGSNLALLRVQEPLIPSLVRSRVRVDIPKTDEALVVVASKDWVRGGAKFLGVKSESGLIGYQINDGLENYDSTRFVFDKSGLLVALAASDSRDESAWLSSARPIVEMLRRQDGPKPASAGASVIRRNQLFGWQDHWTKTIAGQRGQWATQSLACKAHLVTVAETSTASLIHNVRAQECHNRFPLALGGNYSAGVQIVTGEVLLRSMSNGDETGAKVADAMGTDLFGDLKKNSENVNLMTNLDCQESRVQNQQGLSVQVKYCTSALKIEPGLNDTTISVSTVDGLSRAYVGVARLRGFSQANTRRMMEAMVDNVRSFR